MATILITGANGFLAQSFMHTFAGHHQFILVSHRPQTGHLTLEQLSQDPHPLTTVDIVLNLAGASIGSKRWTNQRKRELINSRVSTTLQLVELLNRYQPQAHLISASAIGIYPPATAVDEQSVIDFNSHDNFSQAITKPWEQAALTYHGHVTRIRLGVVFSSQGGAFPAMLRPFLFGTGGRLGSGYQYLPWIALPDVMQALAMIISTQAGGVFNLVAPQQITNRQLSAKIAQVWQRPNWLHLPPWLIQLIFGQMGEELFLTSLQVIPQRLMQNPEFKFSYPDLDSCLTAIKHQQF